MNASCLTYQLFIDTLSTAKLIHTTKKICRLFAHTMSTLWPQNVTTADFLTVALIGVPVQYAASHASIQFNVLYTKNFRTC